MLLLLVVYAAGSYNCAIVKMFYIHSRPPSADFFTDIRPTNDVLSPSALAIGGNITLNTAIGGHPRVEYNHGMDS